MLSNSNSYSSNHGYSLAIVDSGTWMHIFQNTTFLSNSRECHAAVASFSGDTSRSTHTGDFHALARTTDGRLTALMDSNSALVVPDSQRTLFSVRQAQQTGHIIIFGSQPGIKVFGNPHDFIPFTQCPQSGLWLLKLYPPQHNKVYPVFNKTTQSQDSQAPTQEQRLNDHQRLGHVSHRRQRELDI